MGEIEYRRTYYESSEGERIYLLDYMIGVEPYERVSKALCAKLVNLSAEMSYGRTVRHGKVNVSRHTVSKKVHALREVVQEVKREVHTPEELHIFADQVEACVNERYDINSVQRIYIHGDGADRIAKLGERFPRARHVLDGFHLEKALKKLGHYSGAKQRMGTLRVALRKVTGVVTRKSWSRFMPGKAKRIETAANRLSATCGIIGRRRSCGMRRRDAAVVRKD